MFRLTLLAFCVFMLGFSASADDFPQHARQPAAQSIRMDVFVRSDRPSAKAVAKYLDELKTRSPGLDVQIHDLLAEREQIARLYEITKSAGRDKPVLPAFHCCDRTYFGFINAHQSGPEIERLYTADIYTRVSCSRCQKLKALLPKLESRWPAIRFVIHEVDEDANDRATWQALCRGSGSVPGLPTIDFAGRVLIGFQDDGSTAAKLDALIEKASGTQKSAQKPVLHQSSPPLGYGSFLVPTLLLAQSSQSKTTETLPLALDEVGLLELELPDEAEESEIGEVISPRLPASDSGDIINVPLLGPLSVSELGMPLFTLAVGLVDGFNPCAMWILVFLLSVLVNIKDRRKILLIAGTFVLVSGLAYFAFMAAWLNLFLFIGIARPVQIGLGMLALFIGIVNVKDFFAFKKGISLSIPESSKPGLYKRVRQIVDAKYLSVAIGGAIVLAVIVNMVELLCTAGLPALYTQILTIQDYPAWKNYAYLALYIIAYMIDDTILVAIVVATLSHRKLQEREGRWLKLFSGSVILVLGLVMLFRPAWLQLGA